MAGNKNSGPKTIDRQRTLLASLAREHTEDALKTLVDLMTCSEEDSVRRACAEALLDRGWGKPFQAVAVASDEEAKQIVYGWLPTQN